MSKLSEMKQQIETRYGVRTIDSDVSDLRQVLAYDLAEMACSGYDRAIIDEHRAFNENVERFITHPVIGEYLRGGTPDEMYLASGVRVLALDAIKGSCTELAPGAVLFRYGYMPFASSIDGNEVCFDLNRNRVVWVDNSRFYAYDQETIDYYDQESDQYMDMAFTPENIARAVVHLADDFWGFLGQMVEGRLEAQLDELD